MDARPDAVLPGAGGRSARAGASRRTDAAVTASLTLALACVYLIFHQRSYWSDGRALIRMVEDGIWAYRHVAYLPVAHAFRASLRPFVGSDPELPLLVLSALCSAGASALVFAAARRVGRSRWGATWAALFVASAPGVWFYATSVEVHPPQLLVASGLVLWAAGGPDWRRGTRSTAIALGFLLALVATHWSGLLWFPAVVAFCFLGLRGAGRLPTLLAGLVVLALVLALVCARVPSIGDHLADYVRAGAENLVGGWSLSNLREALLLPAGSVHALAALALLRARPRGLGRPARVALVALYVVFVAVACTFGVEARGAYYVSLLPVSAVAASSLLDRGRLPFLAAGGILVAVQLGVATRAVATWEHGYPEAGWVASLREEMRDEGIVLTSTIHEAQVVFTHSRLDVLCAAEEAVPWPREERERYVLAIVEGRRTSDRVAILRSLWESRRADDGVAAFVRGLVDLLGEPVPGESPAYLVFPAPSRAGGRER